MKGINELTAYQLKHWNCEKEILGKYTPARPEGRRGFIRRLKWRTKFLQVKLMYLYGIGSNL